MNSGDWAGLVQEFLHHRRYSIGTQDAYSLALRNFAEWFEGARVEPVSATQQDMLRFREFLRDRGYSPNTVNTRFKNVRSFYDFLRRTGRVALNPAGDIDVIEVGLARPMSLTVDELARMWSVGDSAERVVIGLLSFCSLGRVELRSARVEELHDRDGLTALTIKSRRGRLNDVEYVVLPDQLATELRTYLSGRRSGYILRTARSGGMVASTYLNHVVRRVARRAEMNFPVTTLTLRNTLRALSLENRFSYVSVVRTASQGSTLLRAELVRNLDLPASEHASVRLGRMLSARESPDSEMLHRAELLLEDRSQHPAAAVMLAGATLERVLRDASAAAGIEVSKKDPTIGTYAALLRGAAVISIGQLRTLERILTLRNDAAHGWFDEVTPHDAQWVVAQARQMISDLRGPEEGTEAPGTSGPDAPKFIVGA
ncbi:tyrosine-type recombinase/integrase [Microbacterium testaceum]|uniref:tyrosine-type recombinase/integrase n=1 Tax=Microbacterium testaceum TaxID=2033 RepID=UPI003829F93B